jgi:hypothetical protein
LNYTFTATVALLTAGIDVARSIHAVKGKTAASRDTALLTLVAIVILLVGQGQIEADIDRYLVSTDLYPKQSHILSRFESQGIPDSNDGFGIAPRVAQILTPDDIGIGKHAEIVPFLRTPDYASLVETTVLYIIDK